MFSLEHLISAAVSVTAAAAAYAVYRAVRRSDAAAAKKGGSSFAGAKPERPKNVGILAMECYFPRNCLPQTALEAADGCEVDAVIAAEAA